MNICTFKKLTYAGLVAVLAVSLQLYAATVDGTFDDNRNDFDYYWYYYDDNTGVGKGDRPQAGPATKASTIDVVSNDSVRHAFGNAADTFIMKSYTFTTGSDTCCNNRFATMPFTIGSAWNADYGKATPYVGIGTMLCAEGDSINLTGAESISFKIRSHQKLLTVNFIVQTKAIDDYSMVPDPHYDAFGYYAKQVSVTTSWETQTVKLADLEQPISWCREFAWDYSSGVTKLAWEISQQFNTTVLPEGSKDTLDIDDITIDIYTGSKTVWLETDATKPTTGLFSDFETDPKNQSALKTYWYAFNDAETGGASTIDTAFAEPIEGSKQLALIIDSGNGAGGSYAPALKFTLGPAVNQNGTMVNGSVGIGINVYDSINCHYWNAQAYGATSIFFQYTYQGDAKYLTLEVRDSNDVADSKNPTRKDRRGKGVVWFKNLLPTSEGVWASVEIPFSELSIHSDWSGANPIPLDPKALTEFKWIVQGEVGVQGKFAIDNIYFPGVYCYFCVPDYPISIINTGLHVANSYLHAFYRNGAINVKLNNPTILSYGRISLINALGSTISNFPVTETAKFIKSFSLKKIPSGIYFVKLNAVDTNGKPVVMQAPVSVIK